MVYLDTGLEFLLRIVFYVLPETSLDLQDQNIYTRCGLVANWNNKFSKKTESVFFLMTYRLSSNVNTNMNKKQQNTFHNKLKKGKR